MFHAKFRSLQAGITSLCRVSQSARQAMAIKDLCEIDPETVVNTLRANDTDRGNFVSIDESERFEYVTSGGLRFSWQYHTRPCQHWEFFLTRPPGGGPASSLRVSAYQNGWLENGLRISLLHDDLWAFVNRGLWYRFYNPDGTLTPYPPNEQGFVSIDGEAGYLDGEVSNLLRSDE